MRTGHPAELSVMEFQNWKSRTVGGRGKCLVLGLQGSVHLKTQQVTIITQRNEMDQLNKRLREKSTCFSASPEQF